MEPSTLVMSTVSSMSAEIECKAPDIGTVAHILTNNMWNLLVRMTVKLSKRRTGWCLQMKNLCLLYRKSFLKSTKPSLATRISLIDTLKYHLKRHFYFVSLLDIVLS